MTTGLRGKPACRIASHRSRQINSRPMTLTDRAFIAAFRRETALSPAPIARPRATAPSRGLPGTGVEVVSFSTTIPAPHVPHSAGLKQRPASNSTTSGLPTESVAIATPKRTLHPPHRQTAPVTVIRRPLSSLTSNSEQQEEFQPENVVSRFRWPAVCTQLGVQHADQMGIVLEAIAQLPGKETKIIGVVATAVGAGCTTMTLALARQAARLGRRIAILEADAALPSLHDQFSLASARGLCDLLAGQATLPQVAVAAHDDRVTAVPWGVAPAIAIDARQRLHLSLASGRLRFAFDLVLADLGTPTFTNRHALDLFIAMHGDAVLLVASEHSPPGRLTEIERQLETNGRPVLGIIQNGAR
jgi:Mrp family chromosome partitioning ATPase